MAEELNVFTGEHLFKDRCRLTTMGKVLLQNHGIGDNPLFYAREKYNTRSGTNNEMIYVCVHPGYDFYRIFIDIVYNQEKIKGYFRVTYRIRRDEAYNMITFHMSDSNQVWWTRAMRDVPKIRDKIQRDNENANIVMQERQARQANERREREQRGRELREREQQRSREREQRELEYNNNQNEIHRNNREIERVQAELRREREMMAEFVAPPPGAQLDLVSTPVPFVPEQPPNA